MSFVRRSSRRLSDILQRAIEPLRRWRKSSSRKSSGALSSNRQDRESGDRTSSAESKHQRESKPPSSVSTIENLYEKVSLRTVKKQCGRALHLTSRRRTCMVVEWIEQSRKRSWGTKMLSKSLHTSLTNFGPRSRREPSSTCQSSRGSGR